MNIFVSIPKDPLLQILSYLEPKELCSTQKVCKEYNNILKSKVMDVLWKRFCEKEGFTQPLNESWRLRFYVLQNTLKGICKEKFYRFPKDSLIHVEENQIYQVNASQENNSYNISVLNCKNGEPKIYKGIESFKPPLIRLNVTFNKDLLFVQDDHIIKIFSRQTQALVDKINRPFLKGYRSGPSDGSTSITADDQHLIFFNSWDNLVVRDIKTKSIVKTFVGVSPKHLKKMGKDVLLLEIGTGLVDEITNLTASLGNQQTHQSHFDSYNLKGLHPKLQNYTIYTGTYLALNPKESILAGTANDGSIFAWDLTTREICFSQTPLIQPENYSMTAPCCVWMGNILFTSNAYYDDTKKYSYSVIEAWNIETKIKLYEKKLHFEVSKLDVTEHQLIVHNSDGKMCILDFSNAESSLCKEVSGMSQEEAWPPLIEPIMPRPAWQRVYEYGVSALAAFYNATKRRIGF